MGKYSERIITGMNENYIHVSVKEDILQIEVVTFAVKRKDEKGSAEELAKIIKDNFVVILQMC